MAKRKTRRRIYCKQCKRNTGFQMPFLNIRRILYLEGIKKVINDFHETGYAAHREDVLLAGKTGTAEDTRERGGSGYVVGKDKQVLESLFGRNP